MSIKEINEEIKNCEKCPELVESRSLAVAGYGDPDADVLFIGLAPGKDGADITGKPFTRDPSGVLLQEMLIEVDLSKSKDPESESPELDNSFLTNIVKCNPKKPGENNGLVNRTPTKKEVENCRDYLSEEISIINPKIIVPLGRKSADFIWWKFEIKRIMNWNEAIEKENKIIFPMYHPGFIIRGGGTQKYSRSDYQEDFSKLKEIINSLKD
ncbi:MAG: uracil-DNA glycosylase [Hadesarchaea archaeon]|nr:uracil-DNA glycosylase [Hadesarchaea archaeon]